LDLADADLRAAVPLVVRFRLAALLEDREVAGFFAELFFAAFLAVVFFAAAFFTAVFFATGFLAAVFFTGAFFAAVLVDAAFLVPPLLFEDLPELLRPVSCAAVSALMSLLKLLFCPAAVSSS
jgi:hypothetical protein